MASKDKQAYRVLTPEVEQAFSRLMERNGGILLPAHVVQSAQDPNNPLHKLFTWDNTEAATRWRLQEARQLISSYEVYFEPLNIRVRAFSALSADRSSGGGYRSLNEVMSQAPLREQLLQQAFKELEAAQNKWRYLQELSEVWGAVDTAKARVESDKTPQEPIAPMQPMQPMQPAQPAQPTQFALVPPMPDTSQFTARDI